MLAFEEDEANVGAATSTSPDRTGGPDAASLVAYRPRVLGLCRRILNGSESAEDACQEALTRALAALPRFRPGAPMWPWLATIAANVCRDMLRDARPTEPLDEERGDSLTVPGPDAVAMQRSRALLVRDALVGVPARYQATLYLRDIEGLSYAEIAEAGGRSVPAVRTNLMRGRRLLARRIERLARERREWPLAGFAAGGAWFRRVRARAGQAQAAIESSILAPLRVAGALPSARWFPFALGPTVASAAAVTAAVASFGFGAAPAQDPPSTMAGRPEPGAVAARGEMAPRAGTEASGDATGTTRQPAVVVGQPETRADGDARIATPTVTVEAGAAPAGASGEQVSGGTVRIGPVGVYCGSPERRRHVMTVVCSTLGESLGGD